METNQILPTEPINPPSAAETSAKEVTPQSVTVQPTKLPIIILILLLLASMSGIIYFYLQNQTLKQQFATKPSPTKKSISPISSPTSFPIQDLTSNWQTYANEKIGFTIKYPQGWRKNELPQGVGFGPKEIQEDVLIGINYYDRNTTNITDIIGKIGNQFSDRKESAEPIGISPTQTADKIIVTSPSNPDWYSETIIYNTQDWIITISNGAMKDENFPFNRGVPAGFTFEKFYRTFQFTN